MQKPDLKLLIIGSFFCVLGATFASDLNSTQILDRRNRRLAPPPRTIKSDRFDPSERFEVALERSETAVSISDEVTPVDGTGVSNYEVLLGSNKKIRDKSVSLGVMSGGSSGVVGGRLEVAIQPIWLSAQIGSGFDYSSWGMGLRKYLFPKLSFLPFFDLKYSQWTLKRSTDANASYPFPTYATKKFFANAYEKQTAYFLSPGLGMAFLGNQGFGLELGAQYLWNFNVEQGALLGSLGLVRYF